jgi:acetyltransferase-like isoleucine patch superfamily enzyme
MRPQTDLAVGRGLIADAGVVLGYAPSRADPGALLLGDDARVRSGTVIYSDSEIGARLQTGHNVVVREGTRIGDDVSIWSNSVVDYGCVLGDRVKVHCNCYIAQYTELEDDVFLAPGVTIANDLYPGHPESARAMAGPRIRARAQIGVNVTILPYVTIGTGAIIGAGSVVTRDIPDGMVAYGNPAVATRPVSELGDIERRVRAARAARLQGPSAARRDEARR